MVLDPIHIADATALQVHCRVESRRRRRRHSQKFCPPVVRKSINRSTDRWRVHRRLAVDTIPQRQRRRHSPPKIVIIIWNCLRIKTYLHISRTFMKIAVILMPQFFFQDASCIHFCMELTPMMHVWLLALKMLESKKKTCAVD